MKILANESIFPLGDFSCHASHFEILPDGSIFAVWFQGSAEGRDDVCIFGSRKVEGQWSAPKRISPDDHLPHWNPVLHLADNNHLMLFYKVGREIGTWQTMVMDSYDGGYSFSDPRPLVPGDLGGRGPVRNKIIVLSDGSWLAPASTETNGWKAFADRSEDKGITWVRSQDIIIPRQCMRRDVFFDNSHRGLIQPSFWEDPGLPGHASALMRSTEGWIFRSDSYDFGQTFGDAYPINLPNNNSGLDLDLLPDGQLILACNPCGTTKDGLWGERTPLSLFYSSDNGKSFQKLTDIATGKGTFAYPALRCNGNLLHLTYTWNRRLIQYFSLEL